jgi:hypothetical protein
MSALNFSANGTRWSVTILVGVSQANDAAGVPRPEQSGLFFRSADGDLRFLARSPEDLPTWEELGRLSNAQLGDLASRGAEWTPPTAERDRLKRAP